MKEKDIYLKMCSTCRKEKPSTDYHNSKNSSDGLSLRCRECRINIKMDRKSVQKVETPDMKNCPQCEIEKSSTEFWKNPVRKYGLDSVCISCRKEGEQKIINTPKIISETKICSKCKETKNTVKEFHKRKKSLDGYQGVCKLCENKRRKNKKEEVKEFKKCITCNQIKNTEISFFKSQKCKDGYRNVCKECVNNQEGVKNSILKKKKEQEENKRKITEFKKCNKCKVLKKVDTDYHKRKDGFDGHRSTCIECIKQQKNK